MKRAIVVAVMPICVAAGARADHSLDTCRDLVRPRGHARSDAVFQADLDFCYNQTGADRFQQDTAAFRRCMLARKWLWRSGRTVRSPPSSTSITYNRDSTDPEVGWHWAGGSRVCRDDCDNPEIPGSSFTCRNVVWLGMASRECTRQY